MLVSIAWAISIHTVTAFLFSSNVARPFWHTALLGPRFLASAFAAGPALIILALQIIDRNTPFKVQRSVIDLMALITTVALQINLFLVGAEIFTDFYFGRSTSPPRPISISAWTARTGSYPGSGAPSSWTARPRSS